MGRTPPRDAFTGNGGQASARRCRKTRQSPGVIEEILDTVNDKLMNERNLTVDRANSKMFRQIEELCEDRDGRPPIVVECAVDEDTTLLIFDVVVPNDLVTEA